MIVLHIHIGDIPSSYAHFFIAIIHTIIIWLEEQMTLYHRFHSKKKNTHKNDDDDNIG